MNDPPLASLSLTHVHYDPSDRVSYLCAYLALVPQALCIIYATLIWSTREAEVGLMFAGQMACEALNWILKRYIKEERPRQMYGKGYGMPSSHAQFVAFYSISLSLFLLLRHNPHFPATIASPSSSSTHVPTTFFQRFLVSFASLLGAAAVAWSRIYLNYHTPKQVLVGCATGAAFAISWFAFTAYLRRAGWVEWGLNLWIARLFRFRDLILTEDPTDAGWARWEEQRNKRDGVTKKQE